MESTIHVMFLCPFARKVWEKVPSIFVHGTLAVRSIDELLKACTRMIQLPPVGMTNPLYPWLLWVLWTSINQFMFEDKSFSETEVLGKALKHAREWQDSTAHTKPPLVRLTTAPLTTLLKLNRRRIRFSVFQMQLGIVPLMQEDGDGYAQTLPVLLSCKSRYLVLRWPRPLWQKLWLSRQQS